MSACVSSDVLSKVPYACPKLAIVDVNSSPMGDYVVGGTSRRCGAVPQVVDEFKAVLPNCRVRSSDTVICLRVRFAANGVDTYFKGNPTTSLKKVFDAFALRYGIAVEFLRFSLDETPLTGDESFGMLALEESDFIHCSFYTDLEDAQQHFFHQLQELSQLEAELEQLQQQAAALEQATFQQQAAQAQAAQVDHVTLQHQEQEEDASSAAAPSQEPPALAVGIEAQTDSNSTNAHGISVPQQIGHQILAQAQQLLDHAQAMLDAHTHPGAAAPDPGSNLNSDGPPADA